MALAKNTRQTVLNRALVEFEVAGKRNLRIDPTVMMTEMINIAKGNVTDVGETVTGLWRSGQLKEQITLRISLQRQTSAYLEWVAQIAKNTCIPDVSVSLDTGDGYEELTLSDVSIVNGGTFSANGTSPGVDLEIRGCRPTNSDLYEGV